MNLALSLVALLLDRLFGYPVLFQRLLGHPVQWMGALLHWLDKKLNVPHRAPRRNRMAGVLALSLYLSVINGAVLLLATGLDSVPYGWALEGVLAAPFLAQKQLGQLVSGVATGLRGSLAAGRDAVAHIVGRDTKALDEAEVSRAAIETLAENASDGVLAPLFWLLVFGLPGIVFYKAVNTADSMIGHRNARYEDFGWAAARLDDVMNWIPARLSVWAFALAAPFVGAGWASALETARRDAPNHTSPNAGWPEAAMAGALGFGLGGPRAYKGRTLNLAQMGQGRRALTPADIDRAIALYRAMLNLIVGLVFAAMLLALISGTVIF